MVDWISKSPDSFPEGVDFKPRNKKMIRDIKRLGPVVHIICLMWVKRSVPATAGARLVVSDSGDILSPKYEPEIIAPAVTAGERPSPTEIPIRAAPKVPATVHELPILSADKAQIIQAAK